tara:strand:- start:3753 stop:5309 length:1557 start_codon:yes stop_codon:yes gene_type:complete
MPYEHDTRPAWNEAEDSQFVLPYDRAYETVRPTCHFDMKKIDIFVQNTEVSNEEQEIIENTFTRVGVTYDYFADYDKWAHLNEYPPYPMIGPGGIVPEPSVFTDNYHSYGFNYSSKMGIGNRKYNWLSHTDLDLDVFRTIQKEIRRPILKAIYDAKQRQDILNSCRIQKYFKRLEEQTGTPAPQWPELAYYEDNTECGFPDCPKTKVVVDCESEDECDENVPASECQDWSCRKLKEVINNIPLECELIKEVLGEQWYGSDLRRYWWDGWGEEEGGVSATKEMLNVIGSATDSSTLIPSGYAGTTLTIPVQGVNAKPPYQDIIGIFECSSMYASEEDVLLNNDATVDDAVYQLIKRPEPKHPFYNVFGGYTADVCGCLEIPKTTGDEGDIEGLLPDYITKCDFPSYGEKYPEYLQYIASEDVRYWNTPNETPLYRKAQMQLLFSSEMEVEVPGDFNIRVGSVIDVVLPTSAQTNTPDDTEFEVNQLNGNWLVVKIKHIFTLPSLHKMRLTLVRDSKMVP